ncbi:Woronin body major protein [Talaromyces islandicus]|uniref:Woronin body major protein n=1 Tax=Talaromyces islandicus TaxID=28573 RepID=A0A0U1LWC7_TALIS|nr:Woronin body major protein [Talaromyces islandicus]
MNGIFPADLVVYLVLFPITCYIFITHRWTGFLPWYYLCIFCLARIVGGALGSHDNSSLPANIIQSVGIAPLVLGVDGLVHEARAYRFPSRSRFLDWTVVGFTSSLMAVALGLSISGVLKIYQGHADPNSLTFWKAGSVMILVVWLLQVFWTILSLWVSDGKTYGPAHQGSTALLQGACAALIPIGLRVIYSLIAVCTQRRDLSPVYGTTAVRVVLMFLPEVLAIVIMIIPLNTTPSASAQTAATRAFAANRDASNALSSAAAAAALRSHATPPTSVENVQSKRMLQRQLSNSSRGSAATAPVRGGSLHRTPSSGSMSSRTFREPSPHRPQTSFGETKRRPPMPPLPQGLTNLTKIGGGRRSSSAQAPPARVTSPAAVLPNGRVTSLDRASSQTARTASPASPPSPRVVRSQHSHQNSLELERPGSRTSINFSYPMNTRPNSPPQSPIQHEFPGNSPEQPPIRSLSPVEVANIQQSVNNASGLKVKKKPKATAPGSIEGSHLAQKSMGSRPTGTGVQGTPKPDKSRASQSLQSPKSPVSDGTSKRPRPVIDDRPQSPVDIVENSVPSEDTNNIRTKPTKRPSTVMEDHDAEEQAEAADTAPHNFTEPPVVEQSPFNNKSANARPNQRPPGHLSIETPETKDQMISNSPMRLSPSTSSTPSSPASDRLAADQTSDKQHPNRPASISPNRSARFSSHLTVSSESPIHEPPPRSMSPAKPALKISSSPDRRLYIGPRTGQTPSEISDATSVASDDGSRAGSKKKAVKVSFDDGPEIVGVAASPPTSPESIDTPPSPIEKTKSRSWFSIAKKKISLKDANDDDFESVLKPRPALPSFGSIRGTREFDEPTMSVINDDNESTSSSDDELANFSASNDHAIGGILASAFSQKGQSVGGSDPQDKEPTVQNTWSETKDTVLGDINEIPSGPMQQQLPTVVEESDSTPVQTPTVALDGPLLGANVDGSLEAVPTISIQPATPGGDNRKSLEIQNMPGGFPMSSPERSATGKAESTPASAVSPQTGPSAFATDAPTTADDDDGESEESVYSDAAEDPDGFDGDGFGSIDAIVDSPMPPKAEPQYQVPESPSPSRVLPATAVAVSPPQSPSTPQATAPEPSTLSTAVTSESPSAPKAASPTESAEPVQQHKDTSSVNASRTAGKQKSFDAYTSWPLPSKDAPSLSGPAQNKAKRSMSGDPHQGSHLRKALGKNEKSLRANPQNRHSTPVMHSVPISKRTSSPPLPTSLSSRKQSSVKTAQKPITLTGSLISARGDDSDSDSSFKRTRRSSRVDGQYSMKRTMRAARPVSMATAETMVGRSTSPRTSSMRMTMRGPPPERSSSTFGSLRNKTASPRMRTSTTAPTLRSRIVDSDDEGDGDRNVFHSRFADSSDDDEPLPSNLTPVRGIPRRRGELDRESTDLEDSSDEESKRAVRNGTIRPGSQMTPAEIEAILSQPRKRGSILSRFTSKSKDGKVRKSGFESAARRDTPLERTRVELAQVKEPEPDVPGASRSTPPKLHKKNATAQGSTWPTAMPPPSRDVPSRPSTSEGLVNGVERPTYIRKSTLDSLESEPIGAASDVVQRHSRKDAQRTVNLDFEARVPIPFSVFPSSYRSDAVSETTQTRVEGEVDINSTSRVRREDTVGVAAAQQLPDPRRYGKEEVDVRISEDRRRYEPATTTTTRVYEERDRYYNNQPQVELSRDRYQEPIGRYEEQRITQDKALETQLDITERDYRRRIHPTYDVNVYDRRYQPSTEAYRADAYELTSQGRAPYPPVDVSVNKETISETAPKSKMGYYDDEGHYHSFRRGVERAADRILHPFHHDHKEEVVVEGPSRYREGVREDVRIVEPRGGLANKESVPIPVHFVRVGDLLILQGRPCQVIRISVSPQTGQHRYLGVDLFTRQLHEESSFVSNPSPSVVVQTMLGPVYKTYRVLDIHDDGRITAMTETGDVKQSLPVVTQGSLFQRIRDAYSDGRGSVRALVINDGGRELVVDYKVIHGSRL